MNNNNQVVEVSKLVKYIKDKVKNDINLLNISLKGELSNISYGKSKHLYFDLKDEKASISGIMFSSNLNNLNFKIKNGDKVIVSGNIIVYEFGSKFQINALNIIKEGIGELFALFEKNKRMLADAGYFDQKYKKKIIKYPKMIAIITGQNTAALKDVLKTINNRYKAVKVIVFPSLVQGNNASKNITETIELINRYSFDTIILARGGGSFEDLNAFNDVELAKAIFNSKIPVITGIGHETDYTIADYVSDLRALTPTDAANKATPSTNEINNELSNYYKNICFCFDNKIYNLYQILDTFIYKLNKLFNNKFTFYKFYLDKLLNRLKSNSPVNKLQIKKQVLYTNTYKMYNYITYKKYTNLINIKNNVNILENNFNQIIRNKHNILEYNFHKINNLKSNNYKMLRIKLDSLTLNLSLLNPNLIMKKGYGIVMHDDKIIVDYNKLKINDEIDIINNNSRIKAIVKKVVNNE